MVSVLCAGMITVDMVYSIDAFPKNDTKTKASDARLTAGGGALYAAATIASLGGKAFLAGGVGDDALGQLVRKSLRDMGIDDRFVRTAAHTATSTSAVLVTPNGDRTIINNRADALFEAGLNLPEPFGFDAVLVDTRWPKGAWDILRSASRSGVPGVVDAEAPVAPIKEALDLASHIAFSTQGLQDYAGAVGTDALGAASVRHGAWVGLTQGSGPVLSVSEHLVEEHPTFPVQAVNTLGAGDAWHGAFALGLARGLRDADAVRYANATAAIKVSRRSDDHSWPTATEVENLLASA